MSMATTVDGGGASLPGAGWFPDSLAPERERLWTGEKWIDLVRPARADRTETNPVAWHPDPAHPGFERLWGGEMWTEEIRRAVVTSAPPAPPPLPATGNQPRLGPLPGAMVTYRDTNPPFRLGGLGLWTMIGLGASVAASTAQLIANQIYIGVENQILDGRTPSLSHVRSVTHAAHVTRSITLIVEAITAILFIVWFYRAYRNLVRVGISDLRFGPGWAAGGWFVPILNFFRQKQIANDIWKASASAGSIGFARRWELALPAVINWWWGTWILSGLLIAIGSIEISSAHKHVAFALDAIHRERGGVWWQQVGIVVAIAAAVLAIIFVRDVTRMQDDDF
jgi:hypothetical protein